MPVGTTIDENFKLLVPHFEPYVRRRTVLENRMDTEFVGNDRVQIISAGMDRKYGTGGPWPLRFPEQKYDEDNLSNFAERRLVAGR